MYIIYIYIYIYIYISLNRSCRLYFGQRNIFFIENLFCLSTTSMNSIKINITGTEYIHFTNRSGRFRHLWRHEARHRQDGRHRVERQEDQIGTRRIVQLQVKKQVSIKGKVPLQVEVGSQVQVSIFLYFEIVRLISSMLSWASYFVFWN